MQKLLASLPPLLLRKLWRKLLQRLLLQNLVRKLLQKLKVALWLQKLLDQVGLEGAAQVELKDAVGLAVCSLRVDAAVVEVKAAV